MTLSSCPNCGQPVCSDCGQHHSGQVGAAAKVGHAQSAMKPQLSQGMQEWRQKLPAGFILVYAVPIGVIAPGGCMGFRARAINAPGMSVSEAFARSITEAFPSNESQPGQYLAALTSAMEARWPSPVDAVKEWQKQEIYKTPFSNQATTLVGFLAESRFTGFLRSIFN